MVSKLQNDLNPEIVGKELYLHLVRDNYLQGSGTLVRDALRILAERYDSLQTMRIIQENDWREKIVGVYIAILRRDDKVLEMAQEYFSKSGFYMLKNAFLLACAVIGNDKTKMFLKALLTPPLDEDSLHEHAAAYEALCWLTQNEDKGILDGIQEQLRLEALNVNVFVSSREHFRQAISFWTS